jgi:hypothetical protein
VAPETDEEWPNDGRECGAGRVDAGAPRGGAAVLVGGGRRGPGTRGAARAGASARGGAGARRPAGRRAGRAAHQRRRVDAREPRRLRAAGAVRSARCGVEQHALLPHPAQSRRGGAGAGAGDRALLGRVGPGARGADRLLVRGRRDAVPGEPTARRGPRPHRRDGADGLRPRRRVRVPLHRLAGQVRRPRVRNAARDPAAGRRAHALPVRNGRRGHRLHRALGARGVRPGAPPPPPRRRPGR